MLKNKYLRGFLSILVVVSVWTWVGIETALIPVYAEICDKNQYTSLRECSTYHISIVALWHFIRLLEGHSGAITALSTVVVALFTWRLWWSTDKLWKEATATRGISDRAAKAAEDAAKAAKDSVDHTKETAERELRAYLTISDMPGETNRIGITMRNFGQTPAYDAAMWGVFTKTDSQISMKESFTVMEQLAKPQVVFPGKTYTAWRERSDGYRFFYGLVEYKSFGNIWTYHLCNYWNGFEWEPHESQEYAGKIRPS